MSANTLNDYLANAFSVDILFFVLGAAVGSYLNVLALRTLAGKSVLYPASHCPQCQHSLAWYDNIPVLSWLFLRGACRYCGQAISWQYPLVELATALIYVAIRHSFLPVPMESLDFLRVANVCGLLLFASTLIAVTVTDFREKLIPHEITYPSMIVGIIYSALVRQDLLGAMAGIGASYIIFDFLAFYGLKIYLMTHGDEPEGTEDGLAHSQSAEPETVDLELDRNFDIEPDHSQDEEPMEVMGGGDAVLSAVMAAYLGWQLLAVALGVGFVVGTLMGVLLLIKEMIKAGLIGLCIKRVAIFSAVGTALMGLVAYLLLQSVIGGSIEQPTTMALNLVALGFSSGALLGCISAGSGVSKPFPFGPALAVGGFTAMFLPPNWSPFH